MDIFRSSKLGRIFDHTSSTYKFYWLWGILDLLPTSADGVLSLKDIQSRMVARAYPSVARFRLSFGQQDKLQELEVALDKLAAARETKCWRRGCRMNAFAWCGVFTCATTAPIRL